MRDCVTDGDSTICLPCYQEDFVTCDECGRIVRASDAVYYSESNCYYCERCYEQRREDAIHPYGYKPKPVFYGQEPDFSVLSWRWMTAVKTVTMLSSCFPSPGKRMYIKHDGSLDEGFEMVTHPMTLEYHCRDFPWQELTQKAVSLGYRSHQTSTCGLHIHVSRRSLGCTDQQQEDTIAESSTSLKNTGTSWSGSAEGTPTSSAGGPVDMAERMIPKSSSAVPNEPLTGIPVSISPTRTQLSFASFAVLCDTRQF